MAAVSIGSASSSSSAPITPCSCYAHKNPKLKLWRHIRQRYKIENLNYVNGQLVHGISKLHAGFLTRRLIPFATSECNSPQTEPNLDDTEQESLNIISKDDSLRSSVILSVDRTDGKPGFISFHGLPYQRRDEILGSIPSKETPKLFWFIGPTVLVAFLVFPSLYLRRILSTVFDDSLLTDFLILFFTEALFYGGVAIFVLLVDHIWRPLQHVALKNYDWSSAHFGFRISSVATLVLSLIIPLVTMGMVWPWTGPAASATLAPYLVGLVVQFAFEQYARYLKTPAWSVIPVIFQVYRLHQLNRAAQLVTALSFSVRAAETTSQTLAINGSLGTLLTVLQILGVICIWSLSSFLMRFLPFSQITQES